MSFLDCDSKETLLRANANSVQLHWPNAWASLLRSFYDRAGLPLPSLNRVTGEAIPRPYRELLVHSKDMTPTLESFYGRPLGLTVLSREHRQEIYLREVVLTAGARPVEYGAIRIFLRRFPQTTRNLILQEQKPLGGILRDEGIPHIGWPQAFFRVEADQHMMNVLGMGEPQRLWGRRNVLLDGARRLLADVLEILAPA